MVKIHFLGTCSGTEPYAGMHHCSLIIEVDGINYWFDAGECCGYTAHTLGIDIMKTKALFISHPHIDHIGGMPHLFFCFGKLIACEKRTLIANNTLEVFLPDMAILDAVCKMNTANAQKNYFRFHISEHKLHQGVVYEDEKVRVSTVPNTHMKNRDGSVDPRAFSFLIEADGRRVVYSGDVGKPYELDPLLENGADLVIMETGHHAVADVCEYAISRGIRRLRFNHHGREIINDRAAAQKLVESYEEKADISIKICYDGMVEEV